ncbi:disease resistance protein RPV1-like [Carya illinoinensis]|uniref:disease resistance protein RPV1-like n=1 Tax=Carya illinoinensis TaxID=32201 RepID=UPI001C72344E|nr:disease resistance protein RPV1-like [Carya illinoinensis]XP_042965053.1 disease resistance protein RPV1-like [Carya illinoinensis]XP_042965054.1 disease resistance protein RPV1-like [Carya illinoinensis]XP_042965055.1 disease resistance protein RPV1-like [Carya illinoinensis]XP_042965056.1 disease resistance protein RPV1-like [Carya illinoinensis]XP_042965057.1 disease resistance protein RPV1-like [Carya illinoinensis]XP_042965058.1 disease resistance protein RPV1-like [Carya illinoinensi
MASSSPSSSFSPVSTHRWDVFLSFRGTDTRNNFIAHLYPALCQRGIDTYKDDENLESGEIISPTLLEAIENSMISIIVLSPNYASSSWCLEELTKILECKETKQQIVLPVFYHVDPSEVRKQEGSFGKALAKHQERFKEDPKVQRWKEALQEVAGLAGKHLKDGINEYEFMHKIIQWVDSKIVKSTYQLDIAEYPIGLESRIKDLNTYLGIGRNDLTLMIGIYGIGGIGKTTIAKAVFNSIGNQFEARCFLADVREISSREDGLVKLQKQLLDDLLGNLGSFNIGNVGATNVMKNKLWYKRVLLILDDVNELRQLKELAGNKNWFGPGSRIVITTRDQHLLTCHDQVDSTYEVQELDDNQSIQLFSWHAFIRDKPDESYVELTKCIIGYAKGLPLALTVLGSALRGRRIQEWESALKKYGKCPHKGIYEILKISYDGLDDNEKDIFLHIACFFKGESVKYVTKILDSCCFSSSIDIASLEDKCLINISHKYFDQYVEMHDLLQEMGKEIVRRESPKEAGERSRLFFHEDVRHVLEENTETNKIEGMLLDFPRGHDKICLHSKAFKKMRNLRLFINHNAQFSVGPKYLSNELRVLDWPQYPLSSLPPNFRGNNLVEFKIPSSLIKELGGLKFKNLIVMDLSNCKFLTETPDLSSSPNLEKLELAGCNNLVEVHHSVGLLDKLWSFSVTGCCELRILPKRFKLRSLQFFHLEYCSSLEHFPEIECEMEFLDELSLSGTSIKELPSSIENLKGLETLYLDRSSVTELPSTIGNLARLREVYASGCIDQLASLRIVKVNGYSQPINIGEVEEDGLQSTPSVVSAGEYEIASTTVELTPTNSSIWKSLEELRLEFCCLSESNFFTYANYFPALLSLDLSGSDIVIFPAHQGVRFPKLQELCLNNCKKLEEILPLPSSIVSVIAHECTSLESFALLSEILIKNNGRNFSNIQRIDLYGCHKLLAIPSWEERRSKERNWPFDLPRNISFIFPGMRIPSWFSYSKEAHDSNLCEIDIIQPHHWNGIDVNIVFYVIFGFRSVGIIEPMQEDISVRIHDVSGWKDLYSQHTSFFGTDSDHVWMYSDHIKAEVSRFRFESKSKRVVFRSVGIHFLKKHEENLRDEDHTGVLYKIRFKYFGPHFLYSSSDKEGDDEKRHSSISELENDDENPNEDLELEKDDENPNERFGKWRREDDYNCNMEPNRCPQLKRPHSTTTGITITELENDDENP